VQSTQPFIRSEIVRLDARLTRPNGVAFGKLAQISVRHSKFRGATIQTDNNLWKYPHDGLVNVFQSGKMDGYLPAEPALVA
jgi:hypothetical protein